MCKTPILSTLPRARTVQVSVFVRRPARWEMAEPQLLARTAGLLLVAIVRPGAALARAVLYAATLRAMRALWTTDNESPLSPLLRLEIFEASKNICTLEQRLPP